MVGSLADKVQQLELRQHEIETVRPAEPAPVAPSGGARLEATAAEMRVMFPCAEIAGFVEGGLPAQLNRS